MTYHFVHVDPAPDGWWVRCTVCDYHQGPTVSWDAAESLALAHEQQKRAGGPVRHRHRSSQLVFNRARNRARARLVKQHQDEYDTLLTEELEQAEAEQTRLEQLAPTPGPVKLKGGPKAKSETIEQRIRVDVARCPKCIDFHDAGHVCLSCGAPPALAPPPRKTPEQRIADLLSLGKSPQWIADNLGEPITVVRAVAERGVA